MSQSPGPKGGDQFDFENNAEDVDPFADLPHPEKKTREGAGASDPFDFGAMESEAPVPSKAPPKAMPPRPKAPPATPPKAASSSVVTKAQAAAAAPVSPGRLEARAVAMASDTPVNVVAVLGKKTVTVQELLELKKGQVVELNRYPNEAIDLVANGKLFAKGELVEIDGKLGVRIIKIFE